LEISLRIAFFQLPSQQKRRGQRLGALLPALRPALLHRQRQTPAALRSHSSPARTRLTPFG
jgi:hypothetical protein